MKTLLVATCCVMAIGATARADYSTDFEGWVDADLEVAPWGAGLPNGTIVTGLGTNTTDVVQLGGTQWAWYEPAVADQFAQGLLEFDVLMNGIAGYPNLYLYVADDDLAPAGVAIHWRISQESGVGDDRMDLYDYGAGAVILTDFMSKNDWVNFKIYFDAAADAYSFHVDGVLQFRGQAFRAAVDDIDRIAWTNGVGYYVQIDNLNLLELVHTISGNVGVGGVTMDGLPGDPVSAPDGSYSALVPDAWTATVTPIHGGYDFSPPSISYSNVTADQTNQDYTTSNYTISGNVAQEGVIMDGFPVTTVSDSSGDYSSPVASGWSGTVVPYHYNYTFNPSQRVYTNVLADVIGDDYTASLDMAPYSTGFEGWVDADLAVEPWGEVGGNNGTIETPQGTGNASDDAVELNATWAWLAPAANRHYAKGLLEFDFNLDSWYGPPPNPYWPAIHLYVADDPGVIALNWQIQARVGVGNDGILPETFLNC